MSGNIKVVVRCRPLNEREIKRGATCLIRMEDNQTFITKKSTSTSTQRKKEDVKAFTLDRSYWSADISDPHYADQELVYNDLGKELLDHAFDGYNCCIFAYGQTGSGKSYTMMGYGEDKGIIPKTCSELFERITDLTTEHLKFQVEVSYIEIYNEKVRDLLNPGNKGNLKVREHPTIGPYVEDLSRLVVNSFEDIDHLMTEGNKSRTVAATQMNETSSRSHAVFTLFLTSNRFDEVANLNTEKAARISLVDLAGSERANSTGATGLRLKEGANINKSLTTLGKVIAALAEQSAHESRQQSTVKKKSGAKDAGPFIPYRDSVLTWLLKDSLGGNSKTAMIAAISPADYDETLSTLRYADQAKRIKNKAVVNEDPNARLIRELKEELQALRDTLMIYAPEEVEKIIQQKKMGSRSSSRAARASSASPMLLISPESPIIATQRGNSLLTKDQVIEQLQSSEKLLSEVNQTWEDKMKKTEEIHKEREKALEELGVIVDKNNMGVYAPKSIHLINLNEDPLMTECLMYQIKPGITRVGREGSDVPADIRLSGPEIKDNHCFFENNFETQDGASEQGAVVIHPEEDAVTLVNGARIFKPKILHSGYRIIFGSGLHHLFRFNHPEEVRRERKQWQQTGLSSTSGIPSGRESVLSTYSTATSEYTSMPDTLDWNFAHSEALRKFGNGEALTIMTDEDLKQLSDGISKVQELRNSQKRGSSDSHQLFDDDSSILTLSPRTSFSSKRFSAQSNAPTLLTDEDDTMSFLSAPKFSLHEEERDKLIKSATEEMQHQLELQKKEYEEKMRSVESSNMKSDELNREKEELADKYAHIVQEMETVLEQQKADYETKIKRISAHLPPGTTLSSDNLLVGYTSKNAAEYLLRQSIDKWRELKYVKMAEDCLIHAVVLKEANIMAKELGKNANYQFIVVHDDLSANPLSFWESTSALQPFTREPDTDLIKESKPCLAVQVIDHVHRVTYIWSILKIKDRLRRMRRIYDYTDRPLFTGQHFNREDPFYETPCPRFSLIGLARVPLKNLTLQLHADNLVDIYCRNSGKIMGQIRVLVTPIARSVSRKIHKDEKRRPPLSLYRKRTMVDIVDEKYLLDVGQQQVFEIRIQELMGIYERDYTQIHAQFRLSSFGNVERYSLTDKIYQTDPISNFGNDGKPVEFGQCQTLSVNITEKMMDVILNKGLTIEVYGQAQPGYLHSLVETNTTSPSNHSRKRSMASPTHSFDKSQLIHALGNKDHIPRKLTSADRRFSSFEKCTHDGILMEERHDVLAWVQICELDADGKYAPVQVMNMPMSDQTQSKQQLDVFSLRQGLQRRVALTLMHDSGRQFEWKEIRHCKIGYVRLVDNKGRQTESMPHPPVEINLFSQNDIVYDKNGIVTLSALGPWDSSLHDSLFLNRITATGQRIRLTLSWQVICDKCILPLSFNMDISVQIQARDTSSMLFRQFLGGSSHKHGHKMSSMFIVQLKPPMTRQVRELWRLNTAHKYVRGEEFIGSWKPRGVSLITDYREARRKMLHRESVAAFRQNLVLAGHPQTKQIRRNQSERFQFDTDSDDSKSETSAKDPITLMKKVIELWTSRYGTREEIVFNQDPPMITSLNHSTSMNSLSSSMRNKKLSNIKLTADIQQLYPSDTVTKKGYLFYPENVDERWQKRWYVLRRPFIIIYEDQSETTEVGFFCLTSARVDYKPDLEDLLQVSLLFDVHKKKKYTFAIYTCNNAYLLQASDFEDMKDWISKIDQFYPIDKLMEP
ncbi:hypothetical protein BDB01DRAFT_769658 [Pilobolus umbonatus]|nr:hypothetical protein BDB01DRAFT_769658 [Pilobolus umbonatus]